MKTKDLKTLQLLTIGILGCIALAACNDNSEEPFQRPWLEQQQLEHLRDDGLFIEDFAMDNPMFESPLNADNVYVMSSVPAEGGSLTYYYHCNAGIFIWLAYSMTRGTTPEKPFLNVETIYAENAPQNRWILKMNYIWAFEPFVRATDDGDFTISSTSPSEVTVTIGPNTTPYERVSTFSVGKWFKDPNAQTNCAFPRIRSVSNTVVIQQPPQGGSISADYYQWLLENIPGGEVPPQVLRMPSLYHQ